MQTSCQEPQTETAAFHSNSPDGKQQDGRSQKTSKRNKKQNKKRDMAVCDPGQQTKSRVESSRVERQCVVRLLRAPGSKSLGPVRGDGWGPVAPGTCVFVATCILRRRVSSGGEQGGTNGAEGCCLDIPKGFGQDGWREFVMLLEHYGEFLSFFFLILSIGLFLSF